MTVLDQLIHWQAPWQWRWPDALNFKRATLQFIYGLTAGIILSVSSTGIGFYLQTLWKKRIAASAQNGHLPRTIELRSDEIVDGVAGLVGHTPLVRITSLSELTGCDILGKAEFLNPGGSVKDRVSLTIIQKAEENGLLHPHTGSRIFEGTVGSTGISIATMARAKGYEAEIIMPDDVAVEKSQALEKLGAIVTKVRPVSIVSKEHFVNLARSRALAFGQTLLGPTGNEAPEASAYSDKRQDVVVTTQHDTQKYHEWDALEKSKHGFFADQFENLANFESHYVGTGPEIYRQTNGDLQAFVAGAGTGGTLAGCAVYLKEQDASIKIVLADPQGSGLYNKVKYGVMYSQEEAEGTRRRHQTDSIVEGIGINRITRNFAQAEGLIDDAYKVTDEQAVAMSRHLVQSDGLFLGSSSAVNLVAAVKLAKKLGPGHRIVTILCDSGTRHYSRFWNDDHLRSIGINVSSDISSLLT